MKKIISFVLLLVCVLCLSVTALGRTELSGLLLRNYNAELYTEESYNKYQKAVNQAIAVQEKANATQEEINAVKEELKTAESGLVFFLNRNTLLTFAEEIDLFLKKTTHNLPSETEQALSEAKAEFLALYESNALTEEQLNDAAEKYAAVMEKANNTEEIKKFSEKDADHGIIVPEKVINSTQSLSKVTEIRLTIVYIGAGLCVLGLVSLIVYLKPPKFLR
ncbi:MAG: hypothetical protein II348_03745 [Clostridia bacterium]|nr:hypothetical protein [Clostridia bacterium]